MNILMVNISLDSKLGGGTAERTRHLAINLAKAGCECEVFAMTGNSWQEEFDSNHIGSVITGKLGVRFPVPLLNPYRAWKSVRSADIIHIMGYWNLLSVAMGFLAVLARKPYMLCPAGEFASVHKPRPIMRAFHVLLGKALIWRASGFIAITDLERATISDVTGAAVEDISVIPNAVSEPAPSTIPANTMLPDRPFILFMGRLTPVKGPDLLVQAYINTPAAHEYPLVLAGPDFGMQEQLQAMLDEAEVPGRVLFVGFLDEKERNEAYRRAMMLVIPSRSEAMSLVALEAGIVELPVLLTNACGFDEVEKIGGGMVVEPSAEGVGRGLEQMLGNLDQLRKMGERLKYFVIQRYSWHLTADVLIKKSKALIEFNKN